MQNCIKITLHSGHASFEVSLWPEMDDLFQGAQIFMYPNGKKQPPIAINFDRSLVKHTFFNQTPAKVLLTILTRLELGEVEYLCLLPETNVTCTLNFHQGNRLGERAAEGEAWIRKVLQML